MGFFKRIAGILGFAKDEPHEVKDEDDDENVDDHQYNRGTRVEPRGPRKGFSVPVQVALERPQIGPVLVPCSHGNGGVQGLKWYAKRLKIDEDGDVADEFLDEVLLETSSGREDHHRPMRRFEVRSSTRPAKVRKQVMSLDGRIQHCVEMEYHGRPKWV